MGAIIKLLIAFYILSLIGSLFIGLLRFLIDVAKWHKAEKKVKIIKSIERGEYNGRINDYGTGRTGDNDTGNGDTGNRNTGDGDTGTGTGDTGTGDGTTRRILSF